MRLMYINCFQDGRTTCKRNVCPKGFCQNSIDSTLTNCCVPCPGKPFMLFFFHNRAAEKALASKIKTRIMTIFSLGVNALKFWMEFRCLVGFSFHDSMIIQQVQPLRHAINSSSIRGRLTTSIYSNAVFVRLTPRKCLSLIGSFNCPSMF